MPLSTTQGLSPQTLLPQSTYRHWQQGLPADLTKPCVVAQWYDSPVLGGSLYAYGKNYSDTSNMSAIAGGWKEVDCVTTKAIYFCRTVSECLLGIMRFEESGLDGQW
jgi:hypothetical protein